MSLGANFVSYI